jgi:hypothetical protein
MDMHLRKIQRDRLLETITTLEAFEVDQKTDADQTDTIGQPLSESDKLRINAKCCGAGVNF